MLVSCGSSGAGLIPSENAGPLVADFQAGRTGGAERRRQLRAHRSGAAHAPNTTSQALPASVDAGLRARLQRRHRASADTALELCTNSRSARPRPANRPPPRPPRLPPPQPKPRRPTPTTSTTPPTSTTTPTSTAAHRHHPELRRRRRHPPEVGGSEGKAGEGGAGNGQGGLGSGEAAEGANNGGAAGPSGGTGSGGSGQ